MKELKRPELMTFKAGGYIGNHQDQETNPIEPLLPGGLSAINGGGFTDEDLADQVLRREYLDDTIEPLLPNIKQ